MLEIKRRQAISLIKRANILNCDLTQLKLHLKSGNAYQIITAALMLSVYVKDQPSKILSPAEKHEFEELILATLELKIKH